MSTFVFIHPFSHHNVQRMVRYIHRHMRIEITYVVNTCWHIIRLLRMNISFFFFLSFFLSSSIQMVCVGHCVPNPASNETKISNGKWIPWKMSTNKMYWEIVCGFVRYWRCLSSSVELKNWIEKSIIPNEREPKKKKKSNQMEKRSEIYFNFFVFRSCHGINGHRDDDDSLWGWWQWYLSVTY